MITGDKNKLYCKLATVFLSGMQFLKIEKLKNRFFYRKVPCWCGPPCLWTPRICLYVCWVENLNFFHGKPWRNRNTDSWNPTKLGTYNRHKRNENNVEHHPTFLHENKLHLKSYCIFFPTLLRLLVYFIILYNTL